MNWYKVSKLIDKGLLNGPDSDQHIYTTCMHCGKYATSETGTGPQEEYVWKSPLEMTDTELEELSEENTLSHGLCPSCLIEKYPKYKELAFQSRD